MAPTICSEASLLVCQIAHMKLDLQPFSLLIHICIVTRDQGLAVSINTVSVSGSFRNIMLPFLKIFSYLLAIFMSKFKFQ
jgi:hypothetical protein